MRHPGMKKYLTKVKVRRDITLPVIWVVHPVNKLIQFISLLWFDDLLAKQVVADVFELTVPFHWDVAHCVMNVLARQTETTASLALTAYFVRTIKHYSRGQTRTSDKQVNGPSVQAYVQAYVLPDSLNICETTQSIYIWNDSANFLKHDTQY